MRSSAGCSARDPARRGCGFGRQPIPEAVGRTKASRGFAPDPPRGVPPGTHWGTPQGLALAGATLGFALPLASAIVHSASLADMVVWAAVALVLQLLCFSAMRLLRRNVSLALAQGDMAEAIVLAAGAVVLGLLNTACLS